MATCYRCQRSVNIKESAPIDRECVSVESGTPWFGVDDPRICRDCYERKFGVDDSRYVNYWPHAREPVIHLAGEWLEPENEFDDLDFDQDTWGQRCMWCNCFLTLPPGERTAPTEPDNVDDVEPWKEGALILDKEGRLEKTGPISQVTRCNHARGGTLWYHLLEK